MSSNLSLGLSSNLSLGLSSNHLGDLRRLIYECGWLPGGRVQEAVGLTELQLSILDVLWERGEATTQDVWSCLTKGRPLALTTVATIMARLERKRVLTHRRDGRQYVYRATVTQSEVRRSKVRELTESLFGGDPTELLSHLVRADTVDDEELRRIRDMLDDVVANSATEDA